jgi:hypothetical protein
MKAKELKVFMRRPCFAQLLEIKLPRAIAASQQLFPDLFGNCPQLLSLDVDLTMRQNHYLSLKDAAPSPLSLQNLSFGYVTNVLWLMPLIERFTNLRGLSLKWWHSEHDVGRAFGTLFTAISSLRSLSHLNLEMGDFNDSYDETNPGYSDDMFACVVEKCPLEVLELSAMNTVLGVRTMALFKVSRAQVCSY